MFSGWTQHLKDEKEKERFTDSILSSKRVLERLKSLIDIEVDTIDQTERDPKAYDNAGWPYKQAYKNGMRHAYHIMKQMVDLDKQQPPKEKQVDR